MRPSEKTYAVSDFTHELVADVKAGGYGLQAAYLAHRAVSWRATEPR